MQERESLEKERSRLEELKRSCEEKEKLIPTQPESQREQLRLQLQQVSRFYTETFQMCSFTRHKMSFLFMETSIKLAQAAGIVQC